MMPFGLAVVLAVAPSAMVFQQRWLGDAGMANVFRETWCSVSFLCALHLPPYFGLVALCWITLVGLFARLPDLSLPFMPRPAAPVAREWPNLPSPRQKQVGRRIAVVAASGLAVVMGRSLGAQEVPAWPYALLLAGLFLGLLIERIPAEPLRIAWRKNGGRLTALSLAHLTLVAVLAGIYGGPVFPWLFLPIAALAWVQLVRPAWRPGPTFGLTSLALILYSLHVNGWWFAVIGDEYSFLYRAIDLLRHDTLASIGENVFNGTAVYGQHPFLSTLLQAGTMLLFGPTSFGWRFSNIYLSALALPLFLVFFRTFIGLRPALLAAFFLAGSSYLMSFGKIGYNNLQAYFVQALVLAAVARAIRTRGRMAYAGVGIALALCFFVYPAAMYIIPVALLLLALYDPPRSAASVKRWALAGGSTALVVFPLLLQPDYWLAKIHGTMAIDPKLVGSPAAASMHLVTNLIYASFSFLYVPDENHFVVVSYVDPIAAALVVLGLATVLRSLRRERFAVFLALSWAMLLVLVGASHDRSTPPTTRMFLLLPWFALFAGIGLEWVVTQLQALGMSRPMAHAVLVSVACGSLALSVYQAYPLSRARQAGTYQGMEAHFLRLAQRAFHDGDPPKRFVFVNDPDIWDVATQRAMIALYGVPLDGDRLREARVNQVVPSWFDEAAAEPNTFFVENPRVTPERVRPFVLRLQAKGKVACPIHNTPDHVVFTLWHSPELASYCTVP